MFFFDAKKGEKRDVFESLSSPKLYKWGRQPDCCPCVPPSLHELINTSQFHSLARLRICTEVHSDGVAC